MRTRSRFDTAPAQRDVWSTTARKIVVRIGLTLAEKAPALVVLALLNVL